MRRYLFFFLFMLLCFTVELRAENAVRFSNATVEPGGRFSVEMLIENDVLLGGATVPFRWSSPDITFDSAVVRPERWAENIRVIYQQTNLAERFSALTFIRSLVQGETGWIPEGDGSIATLHFTVSSSTDDQYAFIDSVYQVRNGLPIRWVNWSTYDGHLIAPSVYPGTVRIGNPASVTMTVSPLSLTMSSNSGALLPVSSVLQIHSGSAIELDWGVTWSSVWLELTPAVGKTPAFPSVRADAFLLPPGTYHDTLVLQSEIAENTPVLIPVAFIVDTAIVEPPVEPESSLLQSQPNPFVANSNPETRILFRLKSPSHVEIAVFDVLGRRIRTLTSDDYGEGEASVTWDGRNSHGEAAASGHYICRMATSSGESSRVIVLIR